MKKFFYKDLNDFTAAYWIYRKDFTVSEKEYLVNSFVVCLCVAKINSKQILSFTYNDSNSDYCLYNRKLIKRNQLYDNFARFLINHLDI